MEASPERRLSFVSDKKIKVYDIALFGLPLWCSYPTLILPYMLSVFDW